MKFNKLMKSYLNEINTNGKLIKEYNISDIFERIVPEVIEWDSCVLIKNIESTDLPDYFSPNRFIKNRTELEIIHNHFHLDEYTNKECSPLQLLSKGIQIMKKIESVLKEQFPRLSFYLAMSFDKNDLDCTIRFHTIRENEECWLDEDLESYREAILVYIVSKVELG
ncbi:MULTISPECIES: hypothetical protein [Bacillus]|uniref:hypothetical protein n=1 Tax=Bacillus TaxID=1386 RepID=UPI001C218B87|nr:hypothetical protein [Bacillus haynesii]UIN46901.1 hypothetical protein LXN06_03900 [Bacillus licheniformis]MBU8685293.1 hypothetical protein [Bacillus haynesii]MCY7797925.1 hypothetical protein [Bacillus haynesii]MCY8144436.1 hypothetical protein [Bacillus haynesii]MCY8354775.1 hypothetical protein [Bacillus haynesii]